MREEESKWPQAEIGDSRIEGPRAPGTAQGERGKWFNCQGSGHLAQDCPNTRLPAKHDGQRYHKCGGRGH